MKFRKKPVVIEAMLWNGRDDETGIKAALEFIDTENLPHAPDDPHVDTGVGFTPADGKLFIPTLEGTMCANPGDWIIRGVKGEYYPCKPDIFAATYEDAASPAEGPTRLTAIREFVALLWKTASVWDLDEPSDREQLTEMLAEHLPAAEGPKPGPRCPKCKESKLRFKEGSDLVGWMGKMFCESGKCAGEFMYYDIEDWTDFAQFFPARAEGDAK